MDIFLSERERLICTLQAYGEIPRRRESQEPSFWDKFYSDDIDDEDMEDEEDDGI